MTRESEDRIAALELKLVNMEALVRGLLAELLDFKAVAMAMSREHEEQSRQDLTRRPVVRDTLSVTAEYPSPSLFVAASPDGSTVIRPRSTRQPDLPVAPAEPDMVRIMQTDGTMKLEPRYGEAKHIDSSGGYGRNRKNLLGKDTQNPLIYAAEEEKPDHAKV
ncbi:MAG: hypothetical protein Q7T80_13320 [Methanoregula sp.]|nr:hypothetical protein [Methanoregula sp.]